MRGGTLVRFVFAISQTARCPVIRAVGFAQPRVITDFGIWGEFVTRLFQEVFAKLFWDFLLGENYF